MKICCIKECDNQVLAMGLCNKHWRRNKKYGSPVALKNYSWYGMTDEARFNQRVRKQLVGCWTWVGSTDRDGYGAFKAVVDGVRYNKAHRFSYAMHKGGDLAGMSVCHRCDNPRCVNPEHLFLGTNYDNVRDRVLKGRSRVPMGADSPHAVLTDEQARAILIDPRPHAQLASEYGVTQSTITSLKARHTWRNITGVEVVKTKKADRRGELCPVAKLTTESVREIRSSEMRGKDLAVKFGVSPQTVTDIRKYRSWQHIN